LVNSYIRIKNDEPVESKLDNKSSSQSQDISNMSEEQKLRKWVGVGQAGRVAKAAFVATLAFTGMSGAMADQFQNVLGNDNATDLSLKGGSTISRTEAALHNLGMTDEQILKVQQEKYENDTLYGSKEARGIPVGKKKLKIAGLSDKIRSRKETPDREIPQSTKETHQGEPGKIAKLQALMDRIKAHPEGRKLLASKEASPPSSEIAPTSSKDIYTQDSSGPCLQWGPTTITDVNFKMVPANDGGTELQVIWNLHAKNICSDLVSNVLYGLQNYWTCPENCVKTSNDETDAFSGSPISIGQDQFSVGVYGGNYPCIESDGNGNLVSVPPDSFQTTATVQGRQNGNMIYGDPFTWTFDL
jgi:hypothetical protein